MRGGLRRFLFVATFPISSLAWLFSHHHHLVIQSRMSAFPSAFFAHSRRRLYTSITTSTSQSQSCCGGKIQKSVRNTVATTTTTTTARTSMMSTSSSSSSSSSSSAAESLQELAQDLIQQQQQKSKLVIAVAGGGGHAIAALAATPGASSVLYEGTVTYDRNSFRNYVARASNADASLNALLLSPDFKYASLQAAKLLSEVSLQRALTYGAVQDSNIQSYTSNQMVGIGSASALVSNKHTTVINDNNNNTATVTTNNNNNSNSSNNHQLQNHLTRRGKSRAFVVATRADGRQWYGNLTLIEGRSRMTEDLMVSHFLLQAATLVNHQEEDEKKSHSHSSPTTTTTTTTLTIPNLLPGDEIHGWFSSPPDPDQVVIEAAERIVQGQAQVILLVPTPTSTSSSGYAYRAIQHAVLPHGSLIFPGSYNPPHVGHAELARAALQEVIGMTGSSRQEGSSPPAVFMEMSLTNPDKPSMDPMVVSQRAQQFFSLMEHMPPNWGLLLTRAPLFAQKVELLQSLIAPPPETSVNNTASITTTDDLPHVVNNIHQMPNGVKSSNDVSAAATAAAAAAATFDRKLFFILGTDTMIRILNPKYYGNNFDAMVRAVRGMTRHQVHFIAGGRVEQGSHAASTAAGDHQNHTNKNGIKDVRFVTGEEELEGLPPDIQDMFTLLRDFRIDISSSAIRQSQQQQQQQQQKQQQPETVIHPNGT